VSDAGHLTDERAQELALASAPRAEAEHLAGCEACRALVEDYRALSRALSALPLPPAPGFAPGVLARIEARRSNRMLAMLGTGLLLAGLWASGLLLRLWVPAPADGAAALAGVAALTRVAVSLAPALLPLQALLGLACAAVAIPAWLALHLLLPADWKGTAP